MRRTFALASLVLLCFQPVLATDAPIFRGNIQHTGVYDSSTDGNLYALAVEPAAK